MFLTPLRSVRHLAALLILGVASVALGDGVQPIVPTSQVTYGSPTKTITSNSDVTIDTTSHVLTAAKGIHVSTITFANGSVLFSTNGITAVAAWGSITGNLNNQSDLVSRFNGVGTSTASLQTQINAVSLTTGTIQTQITNLVQSTTSLNASITALRVSTTSLQNQVTANGASITNLVQSTTSLQSQINAIFPVNLNTQVTGILAPSHLVSTMAYTTADQSFSGLNAWTGPRVSTFTFGVAAGSMTVNDLTPNLFAVTDANKKLTSFDLFASTNIFSGAQSFSSPVGIFVGGGVLTSSVTLSALTGSGVIHGNSSTPLGVSPVNLATEVSGNLGVSHFNGGLGAAATNYWAGDGTWKDINAPASGGSSLAVFNNGILISSPTQAINTTAAFRVTLVGGATALWAADGSSVTLQGNTFNSANQLVRLTAGNQYPGADGNLITNLNSAQLNPPIPAGTTVYPATATARFPFGMNVSTITVSTMTVTGRIVLADGTIITSTSTFGGGSGASGSTIYPASGTASFPFGLSASTITVSSAGIFNTDSVRVLGYSDVAGVFESVSLGANAKGLGGVANTAVGGSAMFAATEPTATTGNTAVGYASLGGLVVGDGNTAVGYSALTGVNNAGSNTAIGGNSMSSLGAADGNTAVGYNSLSYTTTGKNNVGVGLNASGSTTGQRNVTGSSGTYIGVNAHPASGSLGKAIAIGYNAVAPSTNTAAIGTYDSDSDVELYVSSVTTHRIRFPDGTFFVSTATISGSGGTGSTIYPATATASFPFGLSASTMTISTATVTGRIVLGDGTVIVSTSTLGGTGSGTVASGTANHAAYYSATGTSVAGSSAFSMFASSVASNGYVDMKSNRLGGLADATSSSETINASQLANAISGNGIYNGNFNYWPSTVSFAPIGALDYVIPGWQAAWDGSANVNYLRVSSITFQSKYSMQQVVTGATGSSDIRAQQPVDNFYDYAGSTVTLSAWVYSNSNAIRIGIADSAGSSTSTVHPGDNAWHQLTVSRYIDASVTSLTVKLGIQGSNANSYFDGVTLVKGNLPSNYPPTPTTIITSTITPLGGITGVINGSNAAAGFVGQYISSTSASTSLFATSGNFSDAISISLPAGDWDVSARAQMANTGGSTPTLASVGAGTVSGNSDPGEVFRTNTVWNATTSISPTISQLRFSLASTTTVYLKVLSVYTVTAPQITNAQITARRVR